MTDIASKNQHESSIVITAFYFWQNSNAFCFRSDSEFKNAFVVLTREFEDRTIFPPPFILVALIWRYLKYSLVHFVRLVRKKRERSSGSPVRIVEETCKKKKNERNVINYFETLCSNEMLSIMEQKKTVGEIVNGTIKLVDEQHSRLTDLQMLYREVDRLCSERFSTKRKVKYQH